MKQCVDLNITTPTTAWDIFQYPRIYYTFTSRERTRKKKSKTDKPTKNVGQIKSGYFSLTLTYVYLLIIIMIINKHMDHDAQASMYFTNTKILQFTQVALYVARNAAELVSN